MVRRSGNRGSVESLDAALTAEGALIAKSEPDRKFRRPYVVSLGRFHRIRETLVLPGPPNANRASFPFYLAPLFVRIF
jgi:hypothetical protein